MFPPSATGYPPLPTGGSPLDQPPPSPQAVGAGATGQPTPASLQSLAPPVPSGQMPPEMLKGILQSAEPVAQILDSWAQALPDKASKFAMIKDMLQSVLAELVADGAPPTSPNATGSAFPAAFDRGNPTAGSA